MLMHLRGELAQRGIASELADARGPVREHLRAAGLEAHVGPIQANASVASIIRAKAA